MNFQRSHRFAGLVAVSSFVLCFATTTISSVLAEPPAIADEATVIAEADNSEADEIKERYSVDEARSRAKLMHQIYTVTLDVMHHRYFHGGRSIVPARAMEDVFKQMHQTSDVRANWISVNLRAMSVQHKPKTEFELRAAKEIAEGKAEVEEVADGYFRRAGAIPMASSCTSCHDGFSRVPTSKPKFAGLVISVPVKE